MTVYSKDISKVYVNITPGPATLAFLPLLFPNGVLALQGGEKEKIKWKRDSALWNKKKDSNGGLHRGRNPDKAGEITLITLDTNPQNEALMALAYISEGLIPVPITDLFSITVDDRLTGSILMSAFGCFIEEMPEGAVEIEPGERAWKAAAAELYPTGKGGKVN